MSTSPAMSGRVKNEADMDCTCSSSSCVGHEEVLEVEEVDVATANIRLPSVSVMLESTECMSESVEVNIEGACNCFTATRGRAFLCHGDDSFVESFEAVVPACVDVEDGTALATDGASGCELVAFAVVGLLVGFSVELSCIAEGVSVHAKTLDGRDCPRLPRVTFHTCGCHVLCFHVETEFEASVSVKSGA